MLEKIYGLRPGMIKFMLVLVFIFNVIGWAGLKKIVSEIPPLTENTKFSREEELQRQMQVLRYAEDLVKIAQERRSRGEIYSPYSYFHDLKLIYLKEKELGVGGSSDIHFELDKVRVLLDESLKHGYTENDIDIAREDYKAFIEPGREDLEKAREQLRQTAWSTILNWVFWLYLKTLPLVFILYLLWAREEQDYREKFRIPRPFRFMVLLAFYPLVLGFYILRAFKDNGRYVYAEAELRRTKRLFSYMSEEELERIKKFAKSNLSLSEWQEQLRELGLKPRHSLASALMVTLAFAFLIRPADAGMKSVKNLAGKAVALEQIAETKNLARANIADETIQEKDGESQDRSNVKVIALIALSEKLFITSIPFLMRKMAFPVYRWVFKILHIPIPAVRFELSTQITHC